MDMRYFLGKNRCSSILLGVAFCVASCTDSKLSYLGYTSPGNFPSSADYASYGKRARFYDKNISTDPMQAGKMISLLPNEDDIEGIPSGYVNPSKGVHEHHLLKV